MVYDQHTISLQASQGKLTIGGQRITAHVSWGLVHLLLYGYQRRANDKRGWAFTSGYRPTDCMGEE